MSRRDFLQEYVEEVREHLQELESSLLVLEREGSNKEEIGHIFRAAHSIKGASSYMGFEGLAHLTHELESLMSGIQTRSQPVTAKGVNLLLECVDFISRALGHLETYKNEIPLPPSLLNDLHEALSMRADALEMEETQRESPVSARPVAGEYDGVSPRKEDVTADGRMERTSEEPPENDLATIRIFLKCFRDQFWELVNAFVLSHEVLLSDADFEHVHHSIEQLLELSKEAGFDELGDVLGEWKNSLGKFQEGGHNERDFYFGILNTYAQRLQEILPSLELPTLDLDSGDTPSEAAPLQEEEDNELLSIFVDSFQRSYAELLALMPPYPDSFLTESSMARAQEILRRLSSSAHYMDYGHIVKVIQHLEMALSDPMQGGSIDGHSYFRLLTENAVRLQDMFPHLQLHTESALAQKDRNVGALLSAEEDEELVGIFLESFQEDLAELTKIAPDLQTGDLGPGDRKLAGEILGRMAASANYMDYEEVVNVVKEFNASLNESDLVQGSDGRHHSDAFSAFRKRLEDLLPVLRISSQSSGLQEDREEDDRLEEQEDEELLSIFVDSFQQNFSQLMTLRPSSPEGFLSEEDLSQARRLIQRSLSSARYMDYGRIVDALKEWDESLAVLGRSGKIEGQAYSSLLESRAQQFQELLPALKLITCPSDPEDVAETPEDVDEGEDVELLNIFLTSFQQNLSELEVLAPSQAETILSEADRDRAFELLKRSISSARYMDYDSVVSILKEWETSLASSFRGGPVNSRAYAQIMEEYGRLLHPILDAIRARLGGASSLDGVETDAPIESLGFAPPVDIPSSGGIHPGPVPDDFLLSPEDFAEEVVEPSEDLALPMLPRVPERKAPGPDQEGPGTRESGPIATLRVNVQKVDQLLNLVMELVVRRSEFQDTAASLKTLLRELASSGKLSREELRRLRAVGFRLNETTLSLGRVATDMQNSVMRVRMLPISQLFQRFPRVIRDQSLKLGKRVELVMEGGETEIDKRVLEQMYDPLVQFLRNAIVHGIEPPAERVASGKPEKGVIRLMAYQEGDYVVLTVEDDGRGVDSVKLSRILQEHGEMSAHELEHLSTQELIQAIFLPGISTHDSVDGSAGRGVGLDVVKDNVERMNGTIEVESTPGVGTRFTIRIPLTVAIIRALLVRGVNQVFALPLNSISQILRHRQDEIQSLEGFQVIQQRGRTIPLVSLSQLLGTDGKQGNQMGGFIVVVTTTFREVGLIVDDLLGEREIVIKPIEDDLHTFDGFSGATILGDGSISLILDVSSLLKMLKDRASVTGATSVRYVH